MTKAAYERSALHIDSDLLRRLGLRGETLGYYYYDSSSAGSFTRSANEFERTRIQDVFGVDPTSVGGWIMRGAVREDDNPMERARLGYDADPWGDTIRVVRHFFDPANNRGLYITAIPPFERNPDWAIGAIDAFAAVIQADANRRNHFTLYDAREAMWRALTGKKADGTELPLTAASPALMRRAYWATAFRALGDVLHMNQDMAQPQHTRNEKHGSDSFGEGLTYLGHKSVIEAYVETAFGGARLRLPGDQVALPLVLDFGSYPIPNFNRYSDFWSTSVGDVAQGRGLADFSNREFFTAGKNLGSSGNDYAWPPSSPSQYSIEVVDNPVDWAGRPINGQLKLLKRPVTDRQNPTSLVVPVTAESAWNQFYQPRSGANRYSLNRQVYQAQAELLVPRAIAYSAGLIDHFFRGRLGISLPGQGVYAIGDHSLPDMSDKETGGFRRIRARVRNMTPNEPMLSTGKLVAVVRFRRNLCYSAPTLEGEPGSPAYDTRLDCKSIEEEITVSDFAPIEQAAINGANGQEVAFTFPAGNPVPINATDVFLQVIYRGPLGSEADAVVVETRDISEPSFFSFDNHSDCFGGPGTPLPAMGIRINGASSDVATTGELQGGGYSRIAVLTDRYQYSVEVSDSPATVSTVIAVTHQSSDVPTEIANPTLFRKGRPATTGGNIYGIAGYGFYNYVPGDDGQQDGFLGAQACTAVNPQPQPMNSVSF